MSRTLALRDALREAMIEEMRRKETDQEQAQWKDHSQTHAAEE